LFPELNAFCQGDASAWQLFVDCDSEEEGDRDKLEMVDK
jgi:hypothetical protein